jgi:hypothetical protein
MEALISHWEIILGVIGFGVWLVRLEGKTLNNEKRIDHLDQQINTMEGALVKELSDVKQSLARIEGYLQATKEHEARSNI